MVGVDFLGTLECMARYGKVRNRGLVGAARVGQVRGVNVNNARVDYYAL